MAIPTFPSPPPAPNRSTDTQEQFDAKAEAWANWISTTFGPDLDDFAAELVAEATSFYNAVSATSLTLTAGEKTANIGAGKAFKPGQTIVFADMSNPTTKRMSGPISSYDKATGALTFVAQVMHGEGTVADWMVTVGGEQGLKGEPGESIKGDKGDQGPPPAVATTSSSANTISTGTKTFTIPAGVAFAPGSIVIAADAANPAANFLVGTVVSYEGTTLTLSVPAGGTGGGGTISDWSLSISGPRGAVGPSAGWAQIGSPLSTASGNVWALDPLPATSSDIFLEIVGMSHNGGGSPTLAIEIKRGGVWASFTSLEFTGYDASSASSGCLQITNYKSNYAMAILGYPRSGSPQVLSFPTSGGLQGVRIRWSDNSTGDAGTITMYGR